MTYRYKKERVLHESEIHLFGEVKLKFRSSVESTKSCRLYNNIILSELGKNEVLLLKRMEISFN